MASDSQNSNNQFTNQDVQALLDFVNYPLIHVQSDGLILRANRAFIKEFDKPEHIEGLVHNLEWSDFLRTFSRSRSPVMRSLELKRTDQSLSSYVVEGCLYQTKQEDQPAVLLLGFIQKENSVRHFSVLKSKLDELSKQNLLIKQFQAERIELLESETRARKKAEQALRLKDEFLATISHELRTPLTSMIGWLDILNQGWITADELPEIIQSLFKSAKAQHALIEDLLDLSRLSNIQFQLRIGPVQVAQIIDDSIKAHQFAAEHKQIEIFQSISEKNLCVSGDADRLKQVLANVLSNAIKYSQKRTRIFIKARRIESRVEIKISDEGLGIDPSFLPYIFEKFLQEDGSYTRTHGGLGLGLAISKHIIEQHGGQISAESPGKNQGSTFTISLPMGPIKNFPNLDSPSAKGLPDSNLCGMRILVVDDDREVQSMLKYLLQKHGAEAVCASSVKEAVATIVKQDFHAVLCDIGMPEESGFRFIEKLKNDPVFNDRSLPTIALTAYCQDEDIKEALAAGFVEHLAKPVEARDLIAAILRHADSKPQHQPCPVT